MCYASPTPEQSLDANLRRFLRSCWHELPALARSWRKVLDSIVLRRRAQWHQRRCCSLRTHGCSLPSVPRPFHTSVPLYFSPVCIISHAARTELRVQGVSECASTHCDYVP